jgi:hypothetical protein
MRSAVVLLLCATLAAPGCAATRTMRVQTTGQQTVTTNRSQTVLTEYAQQIPVGARVRVTATGHRTIRGTLVKKTDHAIFVQLRTRIAEPPVEIPIGELIAMDEERPSEGGGVGKAIAAGAAAGAGAALGTLLILFAIFSD